MLSNLTDEKQRTRTDRISQSSETESISSDNQRTKPSGEESQPLCTETRQSRSGILPTHNCNSPEVTGVKSEPVDLDFLIEAQSVRSSVPHSPYTVNSEDTQAIDSQDDISDEIQCTHAVSGQLLSLQKESSALHMSALLGDFTYGKPEKSSEGE